MDHWESYALAFVVGGLLAMAVVWGMSCVGLTPAMGGKTKVRTDFTDHVEPTTDVATGAVLEGGQSTEYHQTVSAPAGVDLQGLTHMGYDWAPDGSGKIVVSGSGTMSSAKQAEMLPVVAQIYAGAFGAAFKSSLETLAPILGQYLADHAALSLWQAQNPRPRALESVVSGIEAPEVRSWLTSLLSRLPAPSAPGVLPGK